jgi:hypothetical protein
LLFRFSSGTVVPKVFRDERPAQLAGGFASGFFSRSHRTSSGQGGIICQPRGYARYAGIRVSPPQTYCYVLLLMACIIKTR